MLSFSLSVCLSVSLVALSEGFVTKLGQPISLGVSLAE